MPDLTVDGRVVSTKTNGDLTYRHARIDQTEEAAALIQAQLTITLRHRQFPKGKPLKRLPRRTSDWKPPSSG